MKHCPSQIFTACRSDLDNSWQCFRSHLSELSCWSFYNGSQWGVCDFTMFGINTDLGINPSSIPHTAVGILLRSAIVEFETQSITLSIISDIYSLQWSKTRAKPATSDGFSHVFAFCFEKINQQHTKQMCHFVNVQVYLFIETRPTISNGFSRPRSLFR